VWNHQRIDGASALLVAVIFLAASELSKPNLRLAMHHVSPKADSQQFLPLDQVTRSHVTTAEAAFYLSRANQTMRHWAMSGNGPVQPHRVHGRLAWPVAGLKSALGV
jgi:hypothetical protein